MGSTVLIAGANGFIGSYVTLLFESLGHRVVPVDIRPRAHDLSLLPIKLSTIRLDVTDPRAVRKLCRAHGVTHMIHSARPWSGNGPEALSFSVQAMRSVMESAREFSVQRVVFASSGAIYGELRKKDSSRVREDETVALYPNRLLRSASILGEWLGDYYAREHGVRFVALRLSSVYGPGQKEGIGAAIREGILGRECRPHLNRASDDLIFVKDVVRAIQIACFDARCVSRAYNVASPRAYSQADLATAMHRHLPEVYFEIGKPLDGAAEDQLQQHHLLDVRLAREELGLVPQFDLESGIAAIAAWVKSEKRRLR